MNYRSYQNSRDLAWRVLLHEGVTELPVNIVQLCRGMGIHVALFDGGGKSDGYCVMVLGQPCICVSERCTPERQRFTIAHELGHILMGHVGKYTLVNREPNAGDNPIEQEANVFASRLLAPACVLWALGIRTPEDIAKLCRISLPAASFRAQRMAILYERDMFLTSPIERQVYEQFAGFVHRKRNEGV